MKFEKLSEKKFEVFKPSEVVSPILISGGYVDTSSGTAGHGRYEYTNGDVNSYDNWQQTGAGENFTADYATASDHTDIT
jgi:hypothetical protein